MEDSFWTKNITDLSVIMLTLFASSFVRIYQKLWELTGFPPWLNFCGHPVHVSYSINISGIPVRQLVPVYRTFLMTYRYEYRTGIPVSIPSKQPAIATCLADWMKMVSRVKSDQRERTLSLILAWLGGAKSGGIGLHGRGGLGRFGKLRVKKILKAAEDLSMEPWVN